MRARLPAAMALALVAGLAPPLPVAAGEGFVGSARCVECHSDQASLWRGSLHAAALRPAEAGDALWTAGQGRATWGKAGSVAFRLEASEVKAEIVESVGGVSAVLPVRYVLGRAYLQQPVVETGPGRLRALPVAFDPARGEWFDVFLGEDRAAGDYGHWTGRGMDAASRCLDCHTTAYREGYDSGRGAHQPRWLEAGIGCEACHGPGSAHVAKPESAYGPFGDDFLPDPTIASADRRGIEVLMDTCASCHSLRRTLAEGFVPGDALLDHYDPVVLDSADYRVDGQLSGESYEWGSFVQSRMHAAGVQCLNCHDAHSGGLRRSGDALCLGCHETRFADKAHTGHEADGAGSRCVACHMPEQVFMARDRRRDHSLRAPDPIGAQESGIPSACETCHPERDRATLAADARRLWPGLLGERWSRVRERARAFAAARRGDTTAIEPLLAIVRDTTQEAAIVRAGAVRLLAFAGEERRVVDAWIEALDQPEAVVRSAAAWALGNADPARPAVRRGLLAAAEDQVLAVRLGAAWALRGADLAAMPPTDRGSVERAFAEWMESARLGADEPEHLHNTGLFLDARGESGGAEKAYRDALRLEPAALPARHNLAMLLIRQGRVDEARSELATLVSSNDLFAPAHYALGMIDGERGDWAGAVRALTRCLQLEPEYPGALRDLTHAYVEAGLVNLARVMLAQASERPGTKREALEGQVILGIRTDDRPAAREAALALVELDPSAAGDPAIADLLERPPPN